MRGPGYLMKQIRNQEALPNMRIKSDLKNQLKVKLARNPKSQVPEKRIKPDQSKKMKVFNLH